MADRDEAIVQALQQDPPRGLGLLLDRYEIPLRVYLRKFMLDTHTVEDVLQGGLIKVLSAAQAYRKRANAQFSTWLFAIFRNEALDVIRKTRREHPVNPEEFPQPPAFIPERSAREWRELADCVRTSLATLPKEQAEAVRLRMYDNLTFQEIGKMLNAPAGTVAYWVAEGLKSMRGPLRAFESWLSE